MRLLTEPATDRVDRYGRLPSYVIRVRNGLNVNVRRVAVGAAAPYFGGYANRLELLARHARAKRLGLWGACPHTQYATSGLHSATIASSAGAHRPGASPSSAASGA